MDAASRRLRSKAQELARSKRARGIRYPAAFRDAAVRCARRRLGRGAAVERVAQDLRVSAPTLARWLGPRSRPLLRPVAVTPDTRGEIAPVSTVVLVTPQGARVEGLDRDTLIAVLRILG